MVYFSDDLRSNSTFNEHTYEFKDIVNLLFYGSSGSGNWGILQTNCCPLTMKLNLSIVLFLRPCPWLSCLLFLHPTSSSQWDLLLQRGYFMYPVWASVFFLHTDSRWSPRKGEFSPANVHPPDSSHYSRVQSGQTTFSEPVSRFKCHQFSLFVAC